MQRARQSLLWLAQRASAAVLALCVVVHLATMIVAVRGGLTAAEILGRTRGSVAWAAFYGVFVVGVAIHAPIGLRTIVAEMARRPWPRHRHGDARVRGGCCSRSGCARSGR